LSKVLFLIQETNCKSSNHTFLNKYLCTSIKVNLYLALSIIFLSFIVFYNNKNINFVALNFFKYILLIFFVLGLIVPKGFLHFAVHIHSIIEHLNHHISEHNDSSILNFIVEHTTDNSHQEKEKHEHNKLPYHKHSIDYHQNITLFQCSNKELLKINLNHNTNSLNIISKQFFPNLGFPHTIWQPPKMN